jgi:transposase
MRRQRRSFTTEFKRESASLVIEQGYSINEASLAVGVGETALRRWVEQLKLEYQGITPSGSKALTPEQQRIQELEMQVKRIEREKEILKKATALLMSDSMKSLI